MFHMGMCRSREPRSRALSLQQPTKSVGHRLSAGGATAKGVGVDKRIYQAKSEGESEEHMREAEVLHRLP